MSFDRDRALDIAMGVFWEKGYADTSVHDLTEAMGLQKSSLYNTFTGKRELYLAALRRYHARCTEDYALIEASIEPLATVRDFVRSVIDDELGTQGGQGCMVANAALEFGGRDGQVTALTSFNLETLARTIRTALRRAQSLGHLDQSVDAVATARLIVTLIQGLRVVAKGIAPDQRAEWLTSATDTCLAPLG
ncbi:TetR/AcrR family transcriptional regulator [Gordonia soli]|uniref:TetR/AcrR family transcriptional regulator n=1 Tax=Gordonia soli TaxID=320799 RepID=UPI000691BC75|nr:TetR/AcrR family transcriptional regulator [Gordonia soli]